MILAIRTDKPEAEIYLLDSGGKVVDSDIWLADRQMSLQLNQHIDELIKASNLDYPDIKGVISFIGPGSFTGLRIGITIANTIAYSLKVPSVGAKGDDWLKSGFVDMKTAKNDVYVSPEYGGEANITKPRK